jgi:hypothetical protein
VSHSTGVFSAEIVASAAELTSVVTENLSLCTNEDFYERYGNWDLCPEGSVHGKSAQTADDVTD